MIFKDFKSWHAPNIIKIPNSQKILIKHLSIYEIIDLIKYFPDKGVVKIMIFIKSLYEWETIGEAARRLGYRYETGLRWLEKWNKDGLDGVKFKWGDGRPSKLDKKQLKELKEDIIHLELKTTKQIKKTYIG